MQYLGAGDKQQDTITTTLSHKCQLQGVVTIEYTVMLRNDASV